MSSTLIQSMRFDERGLIPAIVQDVSTGDVLGFYYIDNDGLGEILKTGRVAFVQDLSSGPQPANFRLIDVRVTQGGASLTALVESGLPAVRESGPVGLAADLGHKVPGHNTPEPELSLVDVGSMNFGIELNELYELIADRKENRPAGSYTTYLFDSGLDKILKKIAEESGEVIIAAKNRAPLEIITEMADLFYHLVVLMVERGVKLGDVQAELSRRRGKSHSNSEPGLSPQPSQE
jgi:phosphoribosyl-ATP pyrophosphohydrolase/phosphoribosyl-AMP cyclohydrolase